MYPEGTKIVPLAHVRLKSKALRNNLCLDDLKQLIQKNGMLTPITVSAIGSCSQGKTIYEVLEGLGRRRYVAAQQLGLLEIPVTVIKSMSEVAQLQRQLIDNRTQKNLSILDEAQAILEILCGQLQLPPHAVTPLLHQLGHPERESGCNVNPQQKAVIEEVLNAAGRSLSNFRTNMLKLVNYPEALKRAFHSGLIGRSKMEVLGKIKDDHLRQYFLKQTIDHKLTKGQLLAQMGATNDPALHPRDKDLEEIHKHCKFDLEVIENSGLWLNIRVVADFQKEIHKWAKYAKTEFGGLQGT